MRLYVICRLWYITRLSAKADRTVSAATPMLMALMLASYSGHTDIVQLLRNAGAV